MGTCSYILTGMEQSMSKSFGTTCHGAGRALSRTLAKKTITYKSVLDQMKERGILLNIKSESRIAEESPQAYKDVNEVVKICEE
ncbi:MAG: hypothetical protein MHPSP_002623, partial [Paramarteilia canceri]